MRRKLRTQNTRGWQNLALCGRRSGCGPLDDAGAPDKRIGDDSEYGETTVEGLRLSGEGRALTPVPGRKVVYAHGWRGIPIWGSRSRGPLERFRRYSVGLGAARLSRTLVAAAMTTPGEM